MPGLLSNGYLYIAQPPLYRVKASSDQHWVYSEQQKEDVMKELKGARKIEVQRYKGLGEMTPEQLWETTMDPETRTLLGVSVEDAARADHIFHVLMGGEVPPRKAFIQAHAKDANLDV
jgi:DNA gyrase subunit B